MTRPNRSQLRFALPSSLNNVESRVRQLQDYLRAVLHRELEVVVPSTYEQLARELLSGRVDAAWAPPFVCARIEAMGVRVLARGVRNGASVYRAAMVCRADVGLDPTALREATAAWSDRDSVAGYLLPMAWLRERGQEPTRVFASQEFVGSFRRALEAVHEGTAQLTSVFAAPGRPVDPDISHTGVATIWPEKMNSFKTLAFTDEAPNDGVAVSMSAPASVVADLEQVLLGMHQSDIGLVVLKECFAAERFEVAPRMGYRALYRVALASL